MTDAVVLGRAFSNNLLAIKNVQSSIDRTSLRLASGLKVNSALENPQNFFTSKSLFNRSSDLQRLLDGLGRSTLAIKAALDATESLGQLIDQAEAIASESQRLQILGQTDPEIFQFGFDNSRPPISQQILADNPIAYWRLDDTAGPAVNLGTLGAAVDGTYAGSLSRGANELYGNGGNQSTQFNGTSGMVLIPDSASINTAPQALRTIELVFSADDLSTGAGRQVLFEEGGNVNAINIYVDDGLIYFNARDAGDFGPFTITAPINEGQTYHAMLSFDGPGGVMSGYLDGNLVGTGALNGPIASHPDDIAIGGITGRTFYHDGTTPSNTDRFQGRISDVALYNTALTQNDARSRAEALNTETVLEFRHRSFENVINEINNLVRDASFRGVALLNDQNIVTDFNEQRTSTLVTEGVDFTFEGLNIPRNDFNNLNELQNIIDNVRLARQTVRAYGNSLVNDLSMIGTREDFMIDMSNTLDEGSDKLINADQNEEGANLLASQTRLAVAQTALRLVRDSQISVLRLFG